MTEPKRIKWRDWFAVGPPKETRAREPDKGTRCRACGKHLLVLTGYCFDHLPACTTPSDQQIPPELVEVAVPVEGIDYIVETEFRVDYLVSGSGSVKVWASDKDEAMDRGDEEAPDDYDIDDFEVDDAEPTKKTRKVDLDGNIFDEKRWRSDLRAGLARRGPVVHVVTKKKNRRKAKTTPKRQDVAPLPITT